MKRPVSACPGLICGRKKPRPHKRLMDKLPTLMKKLEAKYAEVSKERGKE